MLEEITLKNFRGFESLELKGLSRVNLIVGRNNTGKTSLLEGIVVFCEPGRLADVPTLFRPVPGNSGTQFIQWLRRDGKGDAKTEIFGKLREQFGRMTMHDARDSQLAIQTPFDANSFELAKAGNIRITGTIFLAKGSKLHVVSVQYKDVNQLVLLVGAAHRKRDGEETLEERLKVIDPRIRKVRVDPGVDGNQVIVDIGLTELIPISQLGEGLYRLTGVLSEIIGESPEVLLIDEVENGLHHSVLRQVWSGLADTAEKLRVQIFATTHSGECLLAAHQAFEKRKSYDLAVIQLFRTETGIQGRVLDQKHVEAAIAGDIELR